MLILGKYKCGFCGKGSQSKKGRQNHKYKYHKVMFSKMDFKYILFQSPGREETQNAR